MAEIYAALETVEHPTGAADKTWLLCVYLPAAKALAAEVRRVRQMRCDGCKHQSKGDGLKVCWHSPIKCTGPYKSIDLTHYPKCDTFGGGCLAWEKRDDL